MFSKLAFIFSLWSFLGHASYESADKTYGSGTISLSGYRRTIIELVKGEQYYSVIPWIKDFMVRTRENFDSEMDAAVDKTLSVTGVKTFDTLPEEILRRSKAANIRYILAKRSFKKGKYNDALNELNRVSDDHPVYPFVANFKATVYAHLGQHKEAVNHFKECIESSAKRSGKSSSRIQNEQMVSNSEYCVAGMARVLFAAKEYNQAELIYLDISKNSFVWPEILFEEAWTSYYLKNYNRTLGKLVSYKAPIFDFIFKPEIDVLKALTYLKMCLYDDAKKTVDHFYDSLLSPSRELRQYVLSRGKNYRTYYDLMADHEDGKSPPIRIMDSILRSVRKDPVYIEMKSSLNGAIGEYNQLRKRSSSSLKVNLMKNIQTVLEEYRNTIGAYVRAGMVSKYAELYSAFQGMSYIKLEVLSQKKERLYKSDVVSGRKRGDVQYIERNEKQYFWTFNGEFWADEIGDYVFALGSEC